MGDLITVLAATGRQGRAVVHALLAAGRQPRAMVRDPDRADARALAAAGAQVVPGLLDDRQAIERALQGAAGVFLYLPGYVSPTVTPHVEPDSELHRGSTVLEAAVRAGVEHVVYASALAADRPDTSPLLAPKTELEQRLRATGLPATVLRPVGFMENYLGAWRGLRPDGRLVSTAPPAVTEQLIAVRDIGEFAARAFNAPAAWVGRSVEIAGDEVTAPALATAIGAAASREVRYEQVSLETVRAADPRRAAALAAMYGPARPAADLAWCRSECPGLLTVDQWLSDPAVRAPLRAYLDEAPGHRTQS